MENFFCLAGIDCKQELEKEDIASSLNKMLLLAGIRKEFNV